MAQTLDALFCLDLGALNTYQVSMSTRHSGTLSSGQFRAALLGNRLREVKRLAWVTQLVVGEDLVPSLTLVDPGTPALSAYIPLLPLAVLYLPLQAHSSYLHTYIGGALTTYQGHHYRELFPTGLSVTEPKPASL